MSDDKKPPVTPLRPTDLSPMMILEAAAEEAANMRQLTVMALDKDGEIIMWGTAMTASQWALLALRIQTHAAMVLHDMVTYD